jgi:multidrug efflux pump subunit AcrA (membrane-fusion protein)
VFEQSSRQARAELTVANPNHKLKPGMFVRAEAILDRAEGATIVPVAAITTRNGRTGVFVVNREGTSVSWHPVEVAITDNDRVQVRGEGISGRVVTLGQQLLDDGAAIVIPRRDTSLRNPKPVVRASPRADVRRLKAARQEPRPTNTSTPVARASSRARGVEISG